MKDMGLVVGAAAVIALLIFGVVKVSEESSQGSNTNNGTVVGPPAPAGYTVDANRNNRS